MINRIRLFLGKRGEEEMYFPIRVDAVRFRLEKISIKRHFPVLWRPIRQNYSGDRPAVAEETVRDAFHSHPTRVHVSFGRTAEYEIIIEFRLYDGRSPKPYGPHSNRPNSKN